MTIWDKVVEYRRYKLAIMWSGGMDTTIAYFYALKNGYKKDDIVLIGVDYGQGYAWKEKMARELLRPLMGSPNRMEFKIDLLREELGNIPTPDRQIIPGRNLMLAYIGSFFADRVWIGALKGEMHRFMVDKNERFFRLATDTLSYVMDRKIVVETPFKKMTKSDILKWFVKEYGKKYAETVMLMTVTCYNEESWACGRCSTCFKRWVAMVNAGLEWKDYFERPPYQSEEARKLIEEYKKALKNNDFTHYARYRIEETMKALEKAGVEI